MLPIFPCYGGIHDGRFYAENLRPLGYRKFEVRGRMIWLWKTIRVEYLNFDILEQAAKADPNEYLEVRDHLEPG